MIRRLRPLPAPAQLSALYDRPHAHHHWPDHRLRVQTTIALAHWHAVEHQARSVADLSCGDATIPRALNLPRTVLGDYAPGHGLDHTGPIETTVQQIQPVDLFVLSETLEHVDDPALVLQRIRPAARLLVLSTPLGETLEEDNPQHLWGWDRAGVEQLLTDAGWQVSVFTELDCRPLTGIYSFGLWACT